MDQRPTHSAQPTVRPRTVKLRASTLILLGLALALPAAAFASGSGGHRLPPEGTSPTGAASRRAAAASLPSLHAGANLLALLAVQQAELSDPAATAGDWFGCSVALSGNTALVGAENATVAGKSGAGAAYIYTRSGGSWSQQAELRDPQAAAIDEFGYQVALSGTTALVGVPYKSVAGKSGAGAAYVFTRSGTSWSQQAELKASNAAANDNFGSSVALSGDTALVGASFKSVAGKQYAGVAYVFTRSGTSWSQQAELKASNAAANDNFGSSVALSGDTALVGAYAKTVAGKHSAGAVFVFARSGTSWSQQAELSDPKASAGEWFGSSLALSGETALVGAYAKTVAGKHYAGVAYVFARSGTSWSQQAELKASDAAANDYFGFSLARSPARRPWSAPTTRPSPASTMPVPSTSLRARGRAGRSRPS